MSVYQGCIAIVKINILVAINIGNPATISFIKEDWIGIEKSGRSAITTGQDFF